MRPRSNLSEFGLGLGLLLFGLDMTVSRGESLPKPSVRIYGEATARSSSMGMRPLTRPFTLAVSGSNWWITTYESPQAIGETNFHWQVLSIADGLLAQCYYSPKVNLLMANLKPLVAPVSCPDQVSHLIWLMLTPSVQADAENQVVLPPVYNPSADIGTNPDLRRKCQVEYLDKSHLWLKQIRFFSDGTVNSYSNGTNSTRRLPAPYDQGFLEARFEAVAATNWNGLTLPLRVIGEVLAPGDGRSPSNLRTNRLIEISVTGIETLPSGFTLPPRPTSALSITDSRAPIAKNQMIGFRVHDGEWPSLETSRAIVDEAKRERAKRGLPSQ